jgi:hypothetical protein
VKASNPPGRKAHGSKIAFGHDPHGTIDLSLPNRQLCTRQPNSVKKSGIAQQGAISSFAHRAEDLSNELFDLPLAFASPVYDPAKGARKTRVACPDNLNLQFPIPFAFGVMQNENCKVQKLKIR